MNETSNSDKPSGAQPPKATLHLKRPVEQGTVRQSFSHGRSKAVVVEKVKRRVLGPGETAPPPPPDRPLPLPKPTGIASPRGPTTAAPAKPAAPPPPKTGVVLPTLTAEQREARAKALARRAGAARRKTAAARRRRPRARREREARETRRARGRRGAQARGGAPSRAGGQFQAPVRGRGSPAPGRREPAAVAIQFRASRQCRCPCRSVARAGCCRAGRRPAWRGAARHSTAGPRRRCCRRRSCCRRRARRVAASSAIAAD